MYAIHGRIHKNGHPFDITTFYLYEDVQGIVDIDHALQIARSIVDPFKEYELNPETTHTLTNKKLFLFALKV